MLRCKSLHPLPWHMRLQQLIPMLSWFCLIQHRWQRRLRGRITVVTQLLPPLQTSLLPQAWSPCQQQRWPLLLLPLRALARLLVRQLLLSCSTKEYQNMAQLLR